MRTRFVSQLIILLAVFAVAVHALPPGDDFDKNAIPSLSATIDNTHYINANNILMFITNHGSFARDLAGTFGNDYGTYYPFTSVADILSGSNVSSPLYAAGLWLGGTVGNQTRVAVAEYSSEYVPGPMASGTFQPDRLEFKIYKLYKDSLATNPNADYTNWPVDQGAPTNPNGTPAMLGDQMIWTVFNDANQSLHYSDAGGTTPMGIEVQMTAWAYDRSSNADTFFNTPPLEVTPDRPTQFTAVVTVVDPSRVTGHEYRIAVEPVDTSYVWHLDDITVGTRLLMNQTNFGGGFNAPTVEGLQIAMTRNDTGVFSDISVVANAGGPVVPPEPAAFQFAGFPVNGDPTARQQFNSDVLWGFHTAGNAAVSQFCNYDDFLHRVFRNMPPKLGGHDYEMRFTGSFDNPGFKGSFAYKGYQDGSVIWVPFELWRIGQSTPNDPSDDVRMVPWIIDESGTYDLESYGADPNCGPGGCEHCTSTGDDDPYTDWVYWFLPGDSTPGESGYLASASAMQSGTYAENDEEIIARTVLVNWNGGTAPPFSQEFPEQGTVFRLSPYIEQPLASPTYFSFDGVLPPPTVIYPAGGEGNTLYLRYRLHNRGGNQISNTYLSLWSDPDLGGPADDLVGCDPQDDIWFAYNATSNDPVYGARCPALGFRLLQGPIVPAPGDSANFFGQRKPGYRNLHLSAFSKYVNGSDPNVFSETYNYMKGLNADGTQYYYNGLLTKFVHAGDPVTRVGDLDFNPADRRMMASVGPFYFKPGDSQEVIVRMAIGQGSNPLSSLTILRFLLNTFEPQPTCCSGLRGNLTGNPSEVIDIADLIYLAQYLFRGGPAPVCFDEGDISVSGTIDISDLVWLVSYMFRDGPAPVSCF